MGNLAFADCFKLAAITVDPQNSFYSSTNGVLFDQSQSTLVEYPSGLGGSYTIPGSVTSIADYAFSYCYNLTNITIPNGVTSIGDDAFENCTTLTSEIIPGSVTDIGEEAFAFCSSLGSVTIPDSVTSIGDYEFYACSSLTNVTIAEGVNNIGDDVFYDCSSLGSVTIPGSVNNIGEEAFCGCFSLTNLTISNGVTSIGEGAFSYCTNLTSAAIPGSVTNIGEGAFKACTSLVGISVDPQNSFYSSTNGVLFDQSQTTLVEYPGGLGGSYTIPGGVTSIGNAAFYECTSLTSVTIPGSITNIGDHAFYDCTNLTSVLIPGSVTSFGDIGDYAFFYCISVAGLYFTGNAPIVDSTMFDPESSATVYYLPGTTGWSNSFAGFPAVLWNPLIQTGDSSFGVQNNQFGFTITNGSTTNIPIVVEACANLASPVWTPLTNVTLTNGSFYFSDPQWTNYPSRFYGLGFP